MTMFASPPQQGYEQYAEGTLGNFRSLGGRVEYLLTSARLGPTSPDDPVSKLMRHLQPVREVMDVGGMTFSELLQRDLDDHRVATTLLPYLLKPQATGPSFFPPLLAVLLPAGGGDDNTTGYPTPEIKQPSTDYRWGARMSDIRFGDAFRVQLILDSEDKPHPSRTARVSWNPERIRLVVLDGQHRAMALLAINRTLNGLWDENTGRAYQGFYETRVTKLVAEAGSELPLDQIVVPVLLCWFPELTGAGPSPRVAARKLFVDVNKNARQPSAARLVLLSDAELVNVFTRALLNRVRSPKTAGPPIWAIEYDNPADSPVSTEKWSAMTNLDLLTTAVRTCVFGPRNYIQKMNASVRRGPLPWKDMNEFMQKQLAVDTIFLEEIEDGDRSLARASLGNLVFPTADIAELDESPLVRRFVDTWGAAIAHVFAELRPHRIHSEALEELRGAWDKTTTEGYLGYEALFIGTGMFWTLRSAFRYHEKKENADEAKADSKIIDAWKILDEKKKPLFEKIRAQRYLGNDSDLAIERANKVYEVFNTNASQLGLLITIASIRDRLKGDARAQAEVLVKAWNTALEPHEDAQHNALILARARDGLVDDPLNRIEQLDTWSCFYFRYLWLELLNVATARASLSESGYTDHDFTEVRDLTAQAREHYLRYQIKRRLRDLKRLNPDTPQKTLEAEARESEINYLRKSILRWTELSEDHFAGWLSAQGFAEEEDEEEDETDEGYAEDDGSDLEQ